MLFSEFFLNEADLSKWLRVAIAFPPGLLPRSWAPSSPGCPGSKRAPWIPGFLPGKSSASQLELGLPGSQFCSLIRYTGERVRKWVDFCQKIQLSKWIPVKWFNSVKLAFFKWKAVPSESLCPALLISAPIHEQKAGCAGDRAPEL